MFLLMYACRDARRPEMAACRCLQPVVFACGDICRGTGAHIAADRSPATPAPNQAACEGHECVGWQGLRT